MIMWECWCMCGGVVVSSMVCVDDQTENDDYDSTRWRIEMYTTKIGCDSNRMLSAYKNTQIRTHSTPHTHHTNGSWHYCRSRVHVLRWQNYDNPPCDWERKEKRWTQLNCTELNDFVVVGKIKENKKISRFRSDASIRKWWRSSSYHFNWNRVQDSIIEAIEHHATFHNKSNDF